MASQKPMSTISYNSEPFLIEKLDDWLKAHIIMSYQYICHKGEDGDKDHIHLRIEPNKRIDPMDLMEQLKEYVPNNPKPLGCRPFRPSKEEDWFLYAVHDEDYLKIKYNGGDSKEKLPYDWRDIKAPFDYDIETAFIRAKSSLRHSAPALIKEIRNGSYIGDLLARGENIYLINAIINALSTSDYKRALEEDRKNKEYIFKLEEAIRNNGFDIIVSDYGDVLLHKRDN